MTAEEAKEILVKHSDLFELAEKNQSLPDSSHNSIQEIWSAYHSLDPGFFMDWCCGSCLFRMIEAADRVRKEYLASKPQPIKMTFPK